MKKLKSFTSNLFQKFELYQLLENLLQLIDKKGSEALKTFVEALLLNTKNSFKQYDAALEAEKKAEAPALYDEKRDWGIRKLWIIVNVYSDYFLLPEKQNAALVLEKIFSRYGTGTGIANIGRDKESGVLTNLLQEMKAETTKPHTAALNVDTLVAYIEENNLAYIKAQLELTEENLKLAGLGKDARIVLIESWKNLSMAINGFATVNPNDEGLADLIDNVNATIDRYISTARRRQKAKKSNQTPPKPEKPAASEDKTPSTPEAPTAPEEETPQKPETPAVPEGETPLPSVESDGN